MVMRTSFKSNKLREGVLQFLIIHHGPLDTIIVRIQNENVVVNGDTFSILFLRSLTLIQ